MPSRFQYTPTYKEQTPAGSRKTANKEDFPVLDGLSLYLISIEPRGMREPHWHPNAHELVYCIAGTAKMTLFGPGSMHDNFLLTPGNIAFIPKGYLHYIENVGETTASLIASFNHAQPEEFNLSTVFPAASAEVMSATFDADPSLFKSFPTPEQSRLFIKRRQKSNEITPKAGAHNFKLQAIDPQIDVAGGTIALCYKENFPLLEGLTMFDLKLNKGGVREPHWHPNAAELDYVISGTARMLIMTPDGAKEVFDVRAGDVVFIPSAYYHYIENIGEEPLHFAVFFNHESPLDIGISGSLGAFSAETLATVLDGEALSAAALTLYEHDVFIGPRLLS